ncbi:hypothetical protein [Mucilaginibacter sp. CSA2-8R]|uniref:hypothetical protein n=1 Tax=Mucilaginibacter sp. CSA2-8R TaxID=3141542 RepID=UPI00315C54B4
MPNITEKDIVEYLKQQVTYHQQEAKRFETLLNGFTVSVPASPKNKNETTAAPQPLKPGGAKSPAPKTPADAPKEESPAEEQTSVAEPAQPIDIPVKYSDDLPVNQKIVFALKEIGSGFTEDIANAMAQYEPKSDAKKLSRQITVPLNELKEAGHIKIEKIGRKDRYSLA